MGRNSRFYAQQPQAYALYAAWQRPYLSQFWAEWICVCKEKQGFWQDLPGLKVVETTESYLEIPHPENAKASHWPNWKTHRKAFGENFSRQKERPLETNALSFEDEPWEQGETIGLLPLEGEGASQGFCEGDFLEKHQEGQKL